MCDDRECTFSAIVTVNSTHAHAASKYYEISMRSAESYSESQSLWRESALLTRDFYTQANVDFTIYVRNRDSIHDDAMQEILRAHSQRI